jgi:hypothetical protein
VELVWWAWRVGVGLGGPRFGERWLGHSSLRQQWFYDDKGAVSVGQMFGMNRLEDEWSSVLRQVRWLVGVCVCQQYIEWIGLH